MTSLESSNSLDYRQRAINLLGDQLPAIESGYNEFDQSGSVSGVLYFRDLRDKHARQTRGHNILTAMTPRIATLSTAPLGSSPVSVMDAVGYGVGLASEALELASEGEGYDWQDSYEFWAENAHDSLPAYGAGMTAQEKYLVHQQYLRDKCSQGLAAAKYHDFFKQMTTRTKTMKPITESVHEEEIFYLSAGMAFGAAVNTLGQLRMSEVKKSSLSY